MKNIALAGKFAVGKTSIANILVENHGYARLSIAASLKQFVNDLYARDVYGDDSEASLQKSDVLWINAPDGKKQVTVRELFQDVGNTMKTIDQDIWLRGLRHRVSLLNEMGAPVVVDDVRFPREADYLSLLGFFVVRISAPEEVRLERYFRTYGVEPSRSEIEDLSERIVDDIIPNLELNGERSSEELADQLSAIVEIND